MVSLYRELSQRPLQFHWTNLVLRFWNSVVKRPGTLCHRAFVADLELALGGATECWASKVLAFLTSLGVEPPTNTRGNDLISYYTTLKLPVESILKVFAKRLDARWECPNTLGDPRVFPIGITGAKACRYMNWMGAAPSRGARLDWLEHTKGTMPQRLHHVLMRFQLGCWELEVNRPNGRHPWHWPGTSRKSGRPGTSC
ncbi:hypothetical protein VOLCADRAFT_108067 [Volvox carteri f. nagariensis]|uniref:Uncharacterized protein n=1 Tax=Volvox carteri f. nagariensis TaxID=3068 RepID=D8UI07_VOLCA|nr:uncharacterized protein VOLCADRAFT_108067 [Volvox carteri f. nagariensis]EFJ40655.1 hypothetical protein VOLCADRAFT_108067 [Volvox carteri f. nagariensis]|eukprot:XP_002958281.1 hypothetical protein VOLCADRAFT_108067 [Volvox carteri f. nagariensis]